MFAVSIFLFMAVNIVVAINSVNVWISFKGAFLRYTGFGLTIASFFIFTLIITYFRREHLKYLINSIVWAGVATIPYGICQYYDMDAFGWQFTFGRRCFSTFGNPVFFGAFLSMVIPLVIYKTTKCKWYGLLIPLFLVCLYCTKCRAGFVAVMVSCAYMVYMQREAFFKNKKMALSALAVFVLFIALNATSREAGSIFKKFTIAHTDPRVKELWPTGLKIIKDYPLLGVGQDNIRSLYCRYLESKRFPGGCTGPLVIDGASEWEASIKHDKRLQCQAMTHQDLIDKTCETGLIGLAFYIFMMYAFFRMTWRKDMMTTCFSASVLAYITQNQFSFGTIPIILLWWYCMAMAFVACNERKT
jgi:O-antigen ligase